jgi:hypothetical protein
MCVAGNFPVVDQNPKPQLGRADILAYHHLQIAVEDVGDDPSVTTDFLPSMMNFHHQI